MFQQVHEWQKTSKIHIVPFSKDYFTQRGYHNIAKIILSPIVSFPSVDIEIT